jgi:subtilisin family serine protease
MRIASVAWNPRALAGWLSVAALLAASGLPAHTPEALAQPPATLTDRLILQVRPGAADRDVQTEVALHGGRVVGRMNRLGMLVAKLPPGRAERVRRLLARSRRFKSVELDTWREPAFIPDDPYVPQAWHLNVLDLFSTWDITGGSAAVTIAILDSGVDPDHPDLAGKLVAGWNFYNNNPDTTDVYGHGTKVAGAAAAAGDNGLGVVGPAYANPIMPIRVTATNGWALDSAIINGLIWAADNGAKVANVSFGGVHQSSGIRSAAQYFMSKGGIVTASAGNYGTDDGSSDNPYVISVSATSSADTRTSWSSFGSYIDVAAPGSGIYTTINEGGYGPASGTSFSAPVTAGVTGLIFAANPDLTPQEAEQILEGNAEDLGTPGFDIEYGWGRVNALNAVMAAAAGGGGMPDLTPPTVTVTAPAEGANLSGDVAVSADASDDVSVTEVRFYVDGQHLATDATAPYSALWDTTATGDGPHAVLAEAYDEAGNRGVSTPVSVTVDNTGDTEAPSVGIIDPDDGESVSGDVTIAAAATDNVGVTLVRFYANDVTVGDDVTEPYTTVVNADGAPSGDYTLRAEAFDASGNQGTSTPVSVHVSGPPDTDPPAVTLTTPAEGDVLSEGVSLGAVATDDIAVAEVRFYIDGALLGIDATAPYGAFWDTLAESDGTHSVLAEATDAAGNLGSSVPVTVSVLNTPSPALPTVAITSPADGIVVDPKKQIITVDASSPAGIAYVELLVDGVPDKKRDKKAPYALKPKVKKWIAGVHLLTVRAVDRDGNVGTASISVTKPITTKKKGRGR